jgi:phosphomannomutase
MERFIFAYEESIGFLPNPNIWDKDGVSTALIFTEMCAYYKEDGKTLWDRLQELYNKFGFYVDETKSYMFEGSGSTEKMKNIMEKLAKLPIEDLNCIDVINRVDYNFAENNLRSNLLRFDIKDGSSFLVRPSGTEPKLKVYITAVAESLLQGRDIIKNITNKLDNIII